MTSSRVVPTKSKGGLVSFRSVKAAVQTTKFSTGSRAWNVGVYIYIREARGSNLIEIPQNINQRDFERRQQCWRVVGVVEDIRGRRTNLWATGVRQAILRRRKRGRGRNVILSSWHRPAVLLNVGTSCGYDEWLLVTGTLCLLGSKRNGEELSVNVRVLDRIRDTRARVFFSA